MASSNWYSVTCNQKSFVCCFRPSGALNALCLQFLWDLPYTLNFLMLPPKSFIYFTSVTPACLEIASCLDPYSWNKSSRGSPTSYTHISSVLFTTKLLEYVFIFPTLMSWTHLMRTSSCIQKHTFKNIVKVLKPQHYIYLSSIFLNLPQDVYFTSAHIKCST